eukprot:CAMPEP_0194560122 /NCGR_PEP_ID=MMETSP0292-20121207/1420_1 /TAXON_ID=39354 /ORGANISM="Heterosigma akashiwo, Strain CCMP2393" /LENGTH=42 /DNA_ID= /DNA_START= /DNA_END= /DNA_ORIENTATION=
MASTAERSSVHREGSQGWPQLQAAQPLAGPGGPASSRAGVGN